MTATLTQSSLYTCRVMHKRLSPKVHQFNYPVFYLSLDLDEIDALDRQLQFFSRNRFNLFSFHDDDHLGGGHGNVKTALLGYLRQQGADTDHIASIRLVAFPRVLGYIFNPVSFFFCYDARQQPLHAVTQVTNTFHEQKRYYFDKPTSQGHFELVTPKHFYVSPFSDLDLHFDFNLHPPDRRFVVHINDTDGLHTILLSTLTGDQQPLSDAELLRCAFTYPLLTLQVITLIHWHALRLWLKRLPVHRKSARRDLQTDVLRPHSTLQTPPA